MRELQGAGVPAACMLRVADLPDFAYFSERGLFRTERHPFLAEPVVAERWSSKSANTVEVPSGPAPLMGEQSELVLADWIQRSEDIPALIEAGVIEPTEPEILGAALAGGLPVETAAAS